MAHRHITNSAELEAFQQFLGSLTMPFTVEWTQGRDRSLEQNRLQFLWARETAEQRGDTTAEEVRLDWKLRHGVPIMRAASIEFSQTYDRCIKPLPYEMKVQAMRIVEVTSLMNVRQMVAYLDAVERECLEQGLVLTAPSADLAAYHSRYRTQEASHEAA